MRENVTVGCVRALLAPDPADRPASALEALALLAPVALAAGAERP
jgi:hypothetical protein